MKNNRKLAALILAAAMTVTTPYTAWGADAFSAGESFGDGTESIPGILTSMLDYGQVGKEYKVQLQADSDVRWSLASGSQLPPGPDFASDRPALRSSPKGWLFSLYSTGR